MASASFVEVISHFAGYLQIFHDIARDRIAYDETIAPRSSEDYTTPRPNYEHPFRPDDMETKAGPSPSLIPDDTFDFIRAHPLRKALSDLPDIGDPLSCGTCSARAPERRRRAASRPRQQ
jgi:hypothetical protein